MNAHRIAFKFFLENPDKIDRERLVPMFHLWIRDQGLSSHLLIDVADYLHTKSGPGVVLVSHEANIAIDDSDGKLGLLYQRKRPYGKDLPERLRIALSSTLESCLKFEHDPALIGHAKFRTDQFLLRIEDRLQAPNNQATFDIVAPPLKALVQKLFRIDTIAIKQTVAPSSAFELTISTNINRPIPEIIDRTGLAIIAS